MVPTEGVEPTHPCGYQILSLARLPVPPHRPPARLYFPELREANEFSFVILRWRFEINLFRFEEIL